MPPTHAGLLRFARFSAMLSLLLAAALVAAAEPDDLASQVRRQLRGLNASALAERDSAERAILALGPAALPLLPAVNDRTPAEVAERLARIRQTLLQRQAEAGTKAALITLDVKDAALADVLAEMSKQSGNAIVDYRQEFGEEPAAGKISLHCEKTPFWQALDQVLDQSNLGVYNYGPQRGIYIVGRPAGHLPRQERVSYDGPFRIAPSRFEAVTDLQNPRNRSLKLFLDVSWEPRLRPINIIQPLAQVAASGGGATLAVDGAEGEPEVTVGHESTTVELQLPLELPARKVEQVAQLKGRLTALVPGPAEEFRFAALPVVRNGNQPKRVEQRKASATVIVDQVRQNNDVWELEMRVKFDNPAQALESHRSWVYDNEAYLEDAKGNRITPGGYEQTRQAKDEVGIKYLFDVPDGIAGQTFVYRTPLAILELPVAYELRDLPLP